MLVIDRRAGDGAGEFKACVENHGPLTKTLK